MKWISYQFVSATINTGTEEKPVLEEVLSPKRMTYSDENLEIVKREAYNGEYTIEDDGQPDPTEVPTQLDAIEAQVVYTAMMTDTLLEV